MATVIRRRALVNPARRRKTRGRRRNLSLKQIMAGFGGKRRQANAKTRRRPMRVNRKRHKRNVAAGFYDEDGYFHPIRASYDYSRSRAGESGRRRKNSAPRRRRRRARRNIAGIVTAGLPFANPYRRRKKKAKKHMAKSYTRRRRRSNAHKTHRRRRRSNPVVRRRRRHYSRRRRHNPVMHHRRRRHYSRRRRHSPRRRRHNPSRSSGIMNSLVKGGYVVAGAVGSRWLTQMGLSLVGQANAGVIGYGGNVVSTLVLGWLGGKFLGRGARPWIIAGGMAGIVLRFLQDQTSFGKMFSLSGMGDAGIGALVPANFVAPPIYNGTGANQRIPAGFAAPAAVPAKAGMGWSTYGTSSYR